MSFSIEKNSQHIYLSFKYKKLCLSSAAFNGGLKECSGFLNLHVDGSPMPYLSPSVTLSEYCKQYNWSENTVGMMTAASMNSFRHSHSTWCEANQNKSLDIWVTCGLSNARRAGDLSDYRMEEKTYTPGTINITVSFSTRLTVACMVEAIGMISEAKSAAMQNLNIKSQLSENIATGTGTDSTAVFCSTHGQAEPYCGKHTKLGEELAKGVINTIERSVTREP
ncbi:adenosylcobinamide amidohydrolase [Aliikangiella sp. IMCC44359]|uniref:adenosylcobinamide amidohydrolase n=1 Tax=Aliikangiella sp. IMCC44359 TaxID=3459125 RepID=UPI00403B2052